MSRCSRLPLPHGMLLIALLWACTREPTSPAGPVGTATITVTTGLQPTFDWTPGSSVHEVTVTRAGTNVILWAAISSYRSNAISPPVDYGTTPAGAIMTANKIDPLDRGVTYRVTVSRFDDRGMRRSVGTTTFVP